MRSGFGKGILLNLTFEKAFQMKKDQKSPVLPYDEYYFRFGNS